MGDDRRVPTSVRPATAADAAGIGPCHLACWQETYSGLLSPEFFAARTPERFTANWRRRLESGQPESVVVGVVDESVVGFAASRASRDEPPVRPLELTEIYLRAGQHGSGLGQALLDAVVGDQPASLWVAESNPRAQAFYRRNSFSPDGTRTVLDSFEGLAEIRMVR